MHINSICSATFPVTCYEMDFLFCGLDRRGDSTSPYANAHQIIPRKKIIPTSLERKSWKALDLSILYRLLLEQVIFPV